MKRKLSLIVLAAMLAAVCLTVLVGCNGLDDFSIGLLRDKMDAQYSKAVGASYSLDNTISFINEKGEEVSCKIMWTADNDKITFSTIENKVGVTVPADVTAYILTGTLVDEKDAPIKLGGEIVTVSHAVYVGGNQGGNTDPTHNHSYQWVDNGDGTHKQHCGVSGCDKPDINAGAHVWGGNDKCTSCGAAKPSGGDNPGTDGRMTAAQVKAEAEGLNLKHGEYSSKQYEVVAYAVKVGTKTVGGSTTVYDIDIADAAGAEKVFTLYHGNLASGSAVPKEGDKVLIKGYLTRFDYASDGSNYVLQIGGSQTTGFATVEVVSNGGNTGTTPPTGGDNPGGEEKPDPNPPDMPEGTTATISLAGKGGTGTEGAVSAAEFAIDGVISAVCGQGSNTANGPKYFTESLRLYGGNTITISAAQGTIKYIAFTYAQYDKGNEITVDVGTFTTDVWTGSAESVTFTIGGTSGHRRIASITVVYA